MATHQTTDRDRIVISKYLLEALSKERQLETALQAQILMAVNPVLEEALSDHLGVTRDQISALNRRIFELDAKESSLPGVATATALVGFAATLANKGLALSKGPLQLLRGTSLADTELRNVRDCYWNEAEEIAHYRVIETVALELGDTKTAALAVRHRGEEEEMQQVLEGLLPAVVRHVVEMETGVSLEDAPAVPRPTTARGRTAAAAATKARRGPHPSPAARAKTKVKATQAGR